MLGLVAPCTPPPLSCPAAVAPAASGEELLDTVQLAEACHLAALGDACLTVLARRLAAAGPFWAEQLRRDRLAACSSESLATLACKLAATVHAGAFQPPEVHNVLPGHGGTAGGFTWCISRFSKQQGRVTSPWVEASSGRGGRGEGGGRAVWWRRGMGGRGAGRQVLAERVGWAAQCSACLCCLAVLCTVLPL